MFRFAAALARLFIRQRIGRPLFGLTFCVVIAHGSFAIASDFVTCDMSVAGASVDSASGGLDLDEEFEHRDDPPEGRSWFRGGSASSNAYGDLHLGYWCYMSDTESGGPGGDSVSFEGERNDSTRCVWPGPDPPPLPPTELTILAKAKGYAEILNDGAGWNLNANGVSFDFGINGAKGATSWSPMPGRHDYEFVVGTTITMNPDGSFPWKLFWQFNDPSHDWSGRLDFGGDTIGIVSILLPDGTTPESHGWEVVHESGALSPNGRVHEPSADFNQDGNVDLVDVNLLTAEANLPVGLSVPPADAKFDLSGNDIVDTADLDQWLTDAATLNGFGSPYLRGDANLDGDVDVWDFDGSGDAQVLSENMGMASGAVWGDGDFNGDGDVDVWDFDGSGDAQVLSENMGTAHDVGATVVPEPSTLVLLAMGTVGLLAYGWRRRKAA